MNENLITPIISYRDIAPADVFNQLLDNTDFDGVLYVPVDEHTSPDELYRCRMDWNIADAAELSREFCELCRQLRVIACVFDDMDGTAETARRLLNENEATLAVWHTYIRPFFVENVDDSVVTDIEERMEITDWVKEISARFAKGEQLKEYEKEALKDGIDITVTPEEKALVRYYYECIIKDSESRVGKSIGAYDEVIRAKRVCKLMCLQAPEIILNKELCMLAQSMAIHRFAITRDVVYKNSICFVPIADEECEEALDELYRPKKSNSRKSMMPLFVYLILKEHSGPQKHLRQKEIIEILKNSPYEISVERKALGRTIHNLEDSGLSVFSDETGVWIE